AAHLRESVIATLETLLARQGSGAAGHTGPPLDGKTVGRLLNEADEAVRQGQARCREWGADRPSLVEIALDDAAQAVVSGDRAGASEAPFAAVQRVLLQRGQMAHGVLTGLQQDLARTLDGLQRVAP